MKKLRKWISLLCVAGMMTWYVQPSVHRLLTMPNIVDEETGLAAPTLRVESDRLSFVRNTSDQRLQNVTGNEKIVLSLFGVVPVRTFTVQKQPQTLLVGGQTVGVILRTRGVQIVGLGSIQTENGTKHPAQDSGLKTGDTVLAVNGQEVLNSEHFSLLLQKNTVLELTCLRDGRTFTAKVCPQADDSGTFCIGAWVRDSTSGIGTLSFYDENTQRFGALGHGVTDVDTEVLLHTATGYLTDARITGVRSGGYGQAGELLGTFSLDVEQAIAFVDKNTEVGIFGTMSKPVDGMVPYPLGRRETVSKGNATILATVRGDAVKSYSVQIVRTDVQASGISHGMMIEVTDPELLEMTGGIVQGVSGSPILQNGKLIGVVTHVFVNDPTKGYGVYAEAMTQIMN